MLIKKRLVNIKKDHKNYNMNNMNNMKLLINTINDLINVINIRIDLNDNEKKYMDDIQINIKEISEEIKQI